jgi:hypothetical protein
MVVRSTDSTQRSYRHHGLHQIHSPRTTQHTTLIWTTTPPTPSIAGTTTSPTPYITKRTHIQKKTPSNRMPQKQPTSMT